MSTKQEIKTFSKDDLLILERASRDPFFFSKFAYVLHPIKGRVQFDLYPFQKRVLYYFLTNQFNIVKKCRQMGLTELLALTVLWIAMFHYNKVIILISLKDRVAKRFLKRIKFMYRNLPPVLQIGIRNGRRGEMGSASEMEFNTGSIIFSLPLTEDAGRSEAVSVLVMDEVAMMQNAESVFTAAFPTLLTGGSAILNSTPYGLGNFYYNTWQDGLLKSNGFHNIDINWDLHPDRDQKWLEKMLNVMGPRRAAQEILGDFLASGNTVFDAYDIKAIEDGFIDKRPIEKRYNGQLLIFEKPKKGEKYFIGADIASGRAKDYSAFTIMDKLGNEVACFKGRMPVTQFKNLLGDIGKEYNFAQIAPELNDLGEAVVAGLQEAGYPNLYYSIQIVKEKGKPLQEKRVPGWYTTAKNRHLIIMGLEEDIREEKVDIGDPFFVHEAYSFIYDDMNRPVAQEKGNYIGDSDDTYSDDSIIGKCICNHIRKGKDNRVTVSPQ